MAANPLAPDWLAEPADANSLAPALWPANARRNEDGELIIAGVSALALVEQFGTPLYVLDEADVRARAATALAAFRDAFARIGSHASVYYAGKAFLSTEVARWVSEAGLNIDVSSGGELAVVLAAGVEAATIGFHGNNKSVSEIERAVSAGVGTIILDSEQEIRRVAASAAAVGRTQPVRLRVNSGVHAHTHEFLATAHDDQKFGMPLTEAERVVALIRAEPSLVFMGLHCHIGSQIFGAEGFERSAQLLLAVHARLLEGGEVPELNLGGGFGIAYVESDDPTSIDVLAEQIAEAVAHECGRLGIPVPNVAFEPGRFIVGPPGITLYSAGTTKPVTVQIDTESILSGKTTATRLYVSVDGGMSDNARTALYGADYSVVLAGRVSAADPILVRIAGKHCESGDIVVGDAYLPGDVAPSDLLAVPATGAYCFSLSSNYN